MIHKILLLYVGQTVHVFSDWRNETGVLSLADDTFAVTPPTGSALLFKVNDYVTLLISNEALYINL